MRARQRVGQWKTGFGAVIGLIVLAVALACPVSRRAAAAPIRQGAGVLEFGVPVTGALDGETFRHVYQFDGRADEVITLTMSRTAGDLDPYLLITDGRGTILASSDDGGPGWDAVIASKRLPSDDRYFVIATRFGQEHGSTTGEYALLLERVGAGTTNTPVIHYGDSVYGRIAPDSPLAFYFLQAERGDVVNIALRRTSGDLDAHLDLALTNGQIIVSNDDDPAAEGTLDAAITNYTIMKTDLYLIVATRFGREAGNTSGSYTLTVTQTPPEALGSTLDEARLIDYGSVLEGALDDENPVRYFRFEAQRGDVITVTMQAASGNLDSLVKLVDSTEAVLFSDSEGSGQRDARIPAYTLPNTGTYYLVATRVGEQEGRSEGTYSLRLTGRPGVAGGRALEIIYGATVNGLIQDAHSAEEHVFFGQAGDVLRIAMERTSDDLDPLVTLLDSDRKQIAFDDDSGGDQNALIDGFALPHDGMYIIVASRYQGEIGQTSGAYLLTLELLRSDR